MKRQSELSRLQFALNKPWVDNRHPHLSNRCLDGKIPSLEYRPGTGVRLRHPLGRQPQPPIRAPRSRVQELRPSQRFQGAQRIGLQPLRAAGRNQFFPIESLAADTRPFALAIEDVRSRYC